MRTSPTSILPAAPEHEWRFSYQFLPHRLTRMTRVVVGAGILGFMFVVARAAW